jgi:hypothetical protein
MDKSLKLKSNMLKLQMSCQITTNKPINNNKLALSTNYQLIWSFSNLKKIGRNKDKK